MIGIKDSKRSHETIPPIVEELRDGGRMVLHCCCAPCSLAVIEYLMDCGIQPVLYYYNPNIYPMEEYLRRKVECTRYALSLGLTAVDGDYRHHDWAQQVQGLESEPERGRRCARCFAVRLQATAQYTLQAGLQVFATTLTSSRWKDVGQVHAAGLAAAASYPGTFFWDRSWRKGGLSERRRQLMARHSFYNQSYCGCEFSLQQSSGPGPGSETAE